MTAKEEVKKLMDKKASIDAEIKELMDVLESQGGVGMTGKLVDDEDYPRSDIDVHTVRNTRHRIICLQNDHKALMREIEAGLHRIHSEAKRQNSDEAMDVEATSAAASPPRPVARVDRVDAESPAELASLKVGDLICQFGSITADNFTGLKDLGPVVQHSEGRSLPITVLRDGKQQRLALTPQKWAGRGLLGCNILPL